MPNCCDKITDTAAKASVLIMAFCMLGQSLVHYKVHADNYMDAATFVILYQACVLTYVLLYATCLAWVWTRYLIHKRMCFPANCIFMAASACFMTLAYFLTP